MPPSARVWLHDTEFCSRMARSATRLGINIELHRWPFCLCSADEVNLQLATELFRSEFYLDLVDPVAARLHAAAPCDPELAAPDIIEVLAEDADIEMLWMRHLDGIEEEPSMYAFHPRAWFEPFAGRVEYLSVNLPL